MVAVAKEATAMKRYRGGGGLDSPGMMLGVALVITGPAGVALAQSGTVTMNGVPEQVIPRVLEIGLGSFSITPSQGTASPSMPSSWSSSDGAPVPYRGMSRRGAGMPGGAGRGLSGCGATRCRH